MDILIVSEYCEDFSQSDNDRFFYLAKLLSEDNDVELITSSFRHTTKKHRKTIYSSIDFSVTFIDEPGYLKNICLKRFFSHYIWGKNLEKYVDARPKKPDIIYCAVPSLTGPYRLAKYCEKHGIRFVIDIQDLWPEAFRMVFDVPIISSVAFMPFKLIAEGIYKRANSIIAVSATYCKRAYFSNQNCDSYTSVYLGTELDQFDSYTSNFKSFKRKKSEIWIAYCGTLGRSYDISCVIDALKILNDQRLRFIVIGDGPRMHEFRECAIRKGVKSLFVGRLPYSEMCQLMSACDIAVNPISHKATGSIINKHADYAAAGLPVVSTQECKEYRNLVKAYNMGFNCRNNDPDDLANKIKRLVDDEKLRKMMGTNARRCAEERFDRKKTYDNIIRIIKSEK